MRSMWYVLLEGSGEGCGSTGDPADQFGPSGNGRGRSASDLLCRRVHLEVNEPKFCYPVQGNGLLLLQVFYLLLADILL